MSEGIQSRLEIRPHISTQARDVCITHIYVMLLWDGDFCYFTLQFLVTFLAAIMPSIAVAFPDKSYAITSNQAYA